MTGPAWPAALARWVFDRYQRLPLLVRGLAVVGWAGFLWYESSLSPKPHQTPSVLRSWLYNAAHVPAFGILAVLAGALAPPRWRVLVGVSTALLYGIVDECHQSYTPGRTSSWTDVLSDTVGGSFALAVFCWLVSGSERGRWCALVLLPFAVGAPTLANVW